MRVCILQPSVFFIKGAAKLPVKVFCNNLALPRHFYAPCAIYAETHITRRHQQRPEQQTEQPRHYYFMPTASIVNKRRDLQRFAIFINPSGSQCVDCCMFAIACFSFSLIGAVKKKPEDENSCFLLLRWGKMGLTSQVGCRE